jgi:hypothetical protein
MIKNTYKLWLWHLGNRKSGDSTLKENNMSSCRTSGDSTLKENKSVQNSWIILQNKSFGKTVLITWHHSSSKSDHHVYRWLGQSPPLWYSALQYWTHLHRVHWLAFASLCIIWHAYLGFVLANAHMILLTLQQALSCFSFVGRMKLFFRSLSPHKSLNFECYKRLHGSS